MRGVAGRLVLISALWLVVFAAVRVAAAPAEQCPDASASRLDAAAVAAVDWFIRNQQPDGSWLFRYDADAGRPIDPSFYASVHHGGAVMALFQAAAEGVSSALAPAESGRQWGLARLHAQDGWLALKDPSGSIETGASALFAAGLLHRRLATGDASDDDTLRAMARFLVAMTDERGSVAVYFDPASGPVPGITSPYPTSQAFWVLALMHQLFPDEGWDEPARRILHYVATARDGVEEEFPSFSDHWAAYGLAVVTAWPDGEPLTAAEVAYAERLAGILGFQVRWESSRTGDGLNRIVRGGRAIPSGLGTLGEGMSALWRTSRQDERLAYLTPVLGERAVCVAGMVADRQLDASEAARYAEPARVEGGWLADGQLRVDDEQHTLSAIVRSPSRVDATITAARISRPGASTNVPAIAAILGVLAVVNPFRLTLGLPRGRNRVRVTAVGAGVAAGVVIGLAAVAMPLLDALRISPPTLRVAVGLAFAVTALIDLVRVPNPEPGLSGWGAAVVPVLVPLVLRPALALGALSLGADWGMVPAVIGALAVWLAAVAAAAVEPPESGPSRRLVRWGMGLVAVALLLLALSLAVDGIYDV